MANDRISQLPVEVLVLPDNAKARVSQVVVEVLVGPTPTAVDNRVPLPAVIASGARW